MQRRIVILFMLLVTAGTLKSQVYYNPNVAIKPIPTLSVYKVVITDSTTTLVIRIRNEKQLAPFFIRTKRLKIRKVGDQFGGKLLSSENVPFYPYKHVFTTRNEIFEFTLVFPALKPPVKYFDLIEDTPQKEFYIQGIILDPDLNRAITKGFLDFQRGDREGALKAFIDVANMDLYFEYGLAYFNILYLLADMNRWEEAKEWYKKFKNHFFYDRKLLENELYRLGVTQKIQSH